jgi:SnoaL-like domain
MQKFITDITKEYFDASNERNFHRIRKLLDENCIYDSENTWLFSWRQDIMVMMEAFFQKYPHLCWTIDVIEELTPSSVEVYFTLEKHSWDNSTTISRWIERLVITKGYIQRIEIRNLK